MTPDAEAASATVRLCRYLPPSYGDPVMERSAVVCGALPAAFVGKLVDLLEEIADALTTRAREG